MLLRHVQRDFVEKCSFFLSQSDQWGSGKILHKMVFETRKIRKPLTLEPHISRGDKRTMFRQMDTLVIE